MFKKLIYNLTKKLFALKENNSRDIGNPESILVVRQHNQLGDLLACVPLFRALKETFPKARVTVIVSPQNASAIKKNKYIDEYFVFDKKKIYLPSYFNEFLRLLRQPYDLAVVPVTVSISFTSNLMARLANAKARIGVRSLNGTLNRYHFLFDRKVSMDWMRHPDQNVSEFCLEILRPFGISTSDCSSEITFDSSDTGKARQFINSNGLRGKELLIGLHVGAGKPPNRWPLMKYAELIERLNKSYNAGFFLTGSSADMEEIDYLRKYITVKPSLFLNRTIPEVAALVSEADLFVTNDTGIMHVAGTTTTPQVSIFGPTNPYNWAPVGGNKVFIRKSDIIDEVSVDEVYALCQKALSEKNRSRTWDLRI
ncbi:MAG TPA: glycosyltransferase family 9 protein [Ignavibacteriales bacterium]|nr:glycosyltransferase family 9 protein [Ignavibacteriales bacterium]